MRNKPTTRSIEYRVTDRVRAALRDLLDAADAAGRAGSVEGAWMAGGHHVPTAAAALRAALLEDMGIEFAPGAELGAQPEPATLVAAEEEAPNA